MQKELKDPKYFACECGADFGEYHVLGCDCEDCLICKKQLLSCGHMELFETKETIPEHKFDPLVSKDVNDYLGSLLPKKKGR